MVVAVDVAEPEVGEMTGVAAVGAPVGDEAGVVAAVEAKTEVKRARKC